MGAEVDGVFAEEGGGGAFEGAVGPEVELGFAASFVGVFDVGAHDVGFWLAGGVEGEGGGIRAVVGEEEGVGADGGEAGGVEVFGEGGPTLKAGGGVPPADVGFFVAQPLGLDVGDGGVERAGVERQGGDDEGDDDRAPEQAAPAFPRLDGLHAGGDEPSRNDEEGEPDGGGPVNLGVGEEGGGGDEEGVGEDGEDEEAGVAGLGEFGGGEGGDGLAKAINTGAVERGEDGADDEDEEEGINRADRAAEEGKGLEEFEAAGGIGADVLRGDPAVVGVPDEDGEGAERGDGGHEPGAGGAKVAAVVGVGEEGDDDADEPEECGVLGEEAQADGQAGCGPGPLFVVDDGEDEEVGGEGPEEDEGGVDGHEHRAGDEHGDDVAQADGAEGEFVAGEEFAGEEVGEDGGADAEGEGGVADGGHGVAEDCGAEGDEPGGHAGFGVVGPVEVFGPQPELGFVGGEVEGARGVEVVNPGEDPEGDEEDGE